MLKIYPEPEVEAATPKWDSPGAEDITAALDKAGLGDEPAPAPEPIPADTPAGETPPAVPETPEGEDTATDSTVPPQTVTLDGVDYTLDEAKEFRRGYMMQSDYTRKTQALSDDRRAFEREKQDFLARQRIAPPAALDRAEGQATRLDEMLNDPEVSEPVRQGLLYLQQQNQNLITELNRRDAQAREDQQITEAMSTFDTTFSELCEKHKVTDPLDRRYLHAAIVEENPDTADLTELRASVQRVFEHTHKGLVQRIEKAKREGIQGLSRLPVPPSTKGGGTTPLKPDTRPPATLDDGSALAEFEDRLNRLRGIAT